MVHPEDDDNDGIGDEEVDEDEVDEDEEDDDAWGLLLGADIDEMESEHHEL